MFPVSVLLVLYKNTLSFQSFSVFTNFITSPNLPGSGAIKIILLFDLVLFNFYLNLSYLLVYFSSSREVNITNYA